MATLRSDVIIPEIFTPYVIEQTTLRDAFLASGVVQPMAELNATEGGDYINVPFWKANLSGDFEVLSDSTSLTPGKITADKQVGVILHRGRAFEARDLAALAAGADPMAAIGAKVASYVANQRQKDLIKCLEGVFGGLTSNTGAAFAPLSFDLSGMTALGPRQVAKARALLGDQGDKLTAIAMHSAVYYDLVERKAIDYVTNTEARGGGTVATTGIAPVFAGSIAGAYGGDNVSARIGDPRCTGIGNERNRLAFSQHVGNALGRCAFIMFMDGNQLAGNTVTIEQAHRDPGVLGGNDIHPAQHLKRPQGDIRQITDRGCDYI